MSQPVLSSKCIAYFEDPETKNSCTPSCPIMELDDEFVFNFRRVENHIGKRKKERRTGNILFRRIFQTDVFMLLRKDRRFENF